MYLLCVSYLPPGFTPSRVLPCVIDVGTNNEELRNDPMYLGLKRPRITGQEYYDIIDEVWDSAYGVAEAQYQWFASYQSYACTNYA